MTTTQEKIEAFLTRGVQEIIIADDLRKKLYSGQKLRVYFGIDPTGTKLHLGHAIILWKLRLLQELGHEVILLIGDFTAKIGDPTGRDAMRKVLDDTEIAVNFKDYKQQASKILDFRKIRIEYNSDWLAKLRFADILELASHFTVQQMLHRDMFDKRIKESKPISLMEFMYPLMQGYDSVAMKVDLEIGGSDQLFNMLAGRALREPDVKNVLAVKLLLGPDGRKMSKTFDNAIYLTDSPKEMFGKIMSMSDELISDYLVMTTALSDEEIKTIMQLENPRDQKILLAKEIIKMYYSEKEAVAQEEEFYSVFSKKELPSDIATFETNKSSYGIVDLLCDTGLAQSKNDAKRVIEGGGVVTLLSEQETKITDWKKEVSLEDGLVIRFGKRKFVKIKLK